MTPEQARDLIIVVLIISPVIGFLVYNSLTRHKKYVSESIARIEGYIESNSGKSEKVTIYTTGHPYTWSEISRDELEKTIKNRSWMPVGHVTGIPVPQRARFLMNYNNEKNSFHIVFTDKKHFDWNSLKFYDEYIGKP